MRYFTVFELDMSKYKEGHAEVSGGSRPRLTLIHKDGGKKYFFKTYTHNPREVWAECLASHVAELMGLEAQEVTIKTIPAPLKRWLHKNYPEQLPKDWKPVGSLARNIFPKNVEITYGAVILGVPSTPLKLSDIEAKIKARYYAAEDLLQNYSDMMIFDILIGNMDRHHENWGVCENNKYKQTVLLDKKRTTALRYFTPLFDHGSSLMFELDDEKVTRLNDDPERLRKYVEENKFGFILSETGNPGNPFDIIEEHINAATSWKPRIIKSLQKVVELDLLALAQLIIKMPSSENLEFNSERRSVLYKSFLLRYNRLREIYERINSDG